MSRTATKIALTYAASFAAFACGYLCSGTVHADPLGFSAPFDQRGFSYQRVLPNVSSVAKGEDAAEVPARLRRQVVAYPTREIAGTIIVDTPNTYLYYVLGDGRAIRYGIGVGREGFTWAGTQSVARKQEWPDWHPPAEMIERQPYLPRMMAGGPGNPLGARAMYLGNTVYRIHGTNAPDTIGTRVSSGCIRLTNEDVSDLFDRVSIGTKVVVLPMRPINSPSMAELDRSIPPPLRAAATGGSIAHRLY
jgi:lipoprotein-anchoring transpeptidase ErfK/SrfK